MSDPHRITSVEQLREVVGETTPGLELKNTDSLNDFATDFIGKSPFLILSTSDADGRLDASPKGDEPGFVRVLDERTLLIPDRPGNRLVYGHQNILSNPHVGVIFIIPGTTETLRINGRASLTNDPELLDSLASRGKPAILALRVEIEECFFHCAKAFLRSKLWKPDSWLPKQKISFGEMYVRRTPGAKPEIASQIDERIEADYRDNL
ncbi:MAG: MSMEG_1061 family FMN-dependent PPOX-type flavoprotein [Acidobacteriota bacterium]